MRLKRWNDENKRLLTRKYKIIDKFTSKRSVAVRKEAAARRSIYGVRTAPAGFNFIKHLFLTKLKVPVNRIKKAGGCFTVPEPGNKAGQSVGQRMALTSEHVSMVKSIRELKWR